MTNPTPLIPAAQAVLYAYKEASDGHYTDTGEWIQDEAGQLAAALRAAADHVPDHQMSAHMLYAIAAELEGAQ